jgi:hypothetical protein
MVANKALNMSPVIVSYVDVKAEDTDMLCLLVHHFHPERHKNIIIATKWGAFSIHENMKSSFSEKKRRFSYSQFLELQYC